MPGPLIPDPLLPLEGGTDHKRTPQPNLPPPPPPLRRTADGRGRSKEEVVEWRNLYNKAPTPRGSVTPTPAVRVACRLYD